MTLQYRLALRILVVTLSLAATVGAGAQDSTVVDDALYGRPFIRTLSATSIGGYLEGNTNYFVEDGISDGFSMEFRRFNIFLFSPISRRINFISELEFEHGTEEIALETALIDFRVNPAFVLRLGILLPPVGMFNQNHDSPLWEFVERPLVSTQIIPSTLSEIGFGANGALFLVPFTFTYALYLTNGLGDGVVSNAEGRTFLPAGKRANQFDGDNNGSPAVSGRVAAQHSVGDIGFSFYTALYNTFRVEGDPVDEKRRVTIAAVDYAVDVGDVMALKGEAAYAFIDVPAGLAEISGDRQWGAFVDAVVAIWRPRLEDYEDAVLNAGLRIEAVDYNAGTFRSTGQRIYDEIFALVPGISFRPSPNTVFRANYRRHWVRDLVGNPAAKTGGIQVGFASYF